MSPARTLTSEMRMRMLEVPRCVCRRLPTVRATDPASLTQPRSQRRTDKAQAQARGRASSRRSADSAADTLQTISEPDRDEDLQDVGIQPVERLIAGPDAGARIDEQRIAEVLVVDQQMIETDVGAA